MGLRLFRETDLVEEILDLLDASGIPATPTNAERIFGADGRPRPPRVRRDWPDITATLPPAGRTLAIEAKVGRNKPTRGQATKLAELEAAGALVVVAYSVADVQAALNEAGYRLAVRITAVDLDAFGPPARPRPTAPPARRRARRRRGEA